MIRNHETFLWCGFAVSLVFAVFNMASLIDQIAGMNNFAIATRNTFYASSFAFVVFSLALALVRRTVWFALAAVTFAALGVGWILTIIPPVMAI